MKPLKKSGQPRINVGLIGTGLFGLDHAKALRVLSQEFVLTTAFDADAQRLKKFLEQNPSVVPSKTLHDMTRSSFVDLVVVATPPSTHEALVVSALEAGKYVLCAKPLSNSMSGAMRIVEASQRSPGRLAVDFQMRYDASFRRLKWICENNRIGGIRSARIQRHSYIPHANTGAAGWWGSWNIAGGGVVITQLIHEIDLLMLLMGRPLAVKGRMDTRYTKIESEDMAEATLFFDQGRTAVISASVNSGVTSGEFKISGDAGEVAMPWSLHLKNGLSSEEAIREMNQALPDTQQTSFSFPSKVMRRLRRCFGKIELAEYSPHAHLYAEIANCIHAGRPLPISASEAMVSLEVCMAIYESALTGAEVALPLQPKCRVFNGVSKALYDRRPA